MFFYLENMDTHFPPTLKLRRAKVEVTGIEPVSKHDIRKLSTCLFQHCLSGKNRS